MKTLLGFFAGILFMMLVLCSGQSYNPSNPNNINKIDIDEISLTKYSGKTIKYIEFLEYPHTVTGCHDLVFHFTDGTEMRVFIYKYTPEIQL